MSPHPLLQSASLWGRSSIGRAPEWHSGGRRFDPDRLHQASFETAFRTTPWQARPLSNAVSDEACHGVVRSTKPDCPHPRQERGKKCQTFTTSSSSSGESNPDSPFKQPLFPPKCFRRRPGICLTAAKSAGVAHQRYPRRLDCFVSQLLAPPTHSIISGRRNFRHAVGRRTSAQSSCFSLSPYSLLISS